MLQDNEFYLALEDIPGFKQQLRNTGQYGTVLGVGLDRQVDEQDLMSRILWAGSYRQVDRQVFTYSFASTPKFSSTMCLQSYQRINGIVSTFLASLTVICSTCTLNFTSYNTHNKYKPIDKGI